MKFSKNLKWFTQVKCNEQDCVIDCLVDTTELNQQEGNWLIKEGEQLKICTFIQLQNVPVETFTILGKVKKRDIKIG